MVRRALYTHNQHLQFGYISETEEYIPQGLFYVSSGDTDKPCMSPLFESMRAAKLIAERYSSETLWLCLSGGVDSECMALSFLYAGVPFKVAICRFPENLNAFDIQYALSFCRKHSLDYQIFDLDILQFYQSEKHIDLCRQYRCNSPQLTAHIEFLKMIPGVPICPWGPPEVRISPSGQLGLSMPTDRYFAFDRYFEDSGHEGVYFFFLYTPELIKAFINLPVYLDCFSLDFDLTWLNRNHQKYAFKVQVFSEAGFLFTPRPDKWTGFEEIKQYFARKHNCWDRPIYEELFRRPLQDIYPDPSDVIVGLPVGFAPYLTANEAVSDD
ncbi:MAG: hypothetical protein CL675_09595 [Bdellovibrionaceae bacterium]|nr:hypothetical protein [Pseudobdellovibrionaceae bacterium]